MFLQMLFVHHYYTHDNFCLFHNKLLSSAQSLRPSNNRHFTTTFALRVLSQWVILKAKISLIYVSKRVSYIELTKNPLVCKAALTIATSVLEYSPRLINTEWKRTWTRKSDVVFKWVLSHFTVFFALDVSKVRRNSSHSHMFRISVKSPLPTEVKYTRSIGRRRCWCTISLQSSACSQCEN